MGNIAIVDRIYGDLTNGQKIAIQGDSVLIALKDVTILGTQTTETLCSDFSWTPSLQITLYLR